MPLQKITIATRNSPLALWQSEWAKAQIQQHYPDLIIELLPVKTQGDILLETSLSKIGGKGLFIKELEQALLENIADIAVHSMKDVPAILPEPFSIAAMLPRGSVEDALVSHSTKSIQALPQNAILGTSSLRRQSQLLHQRPDLNIVPIRGNLQTRLKKLTDENLDGIILACAGLERLNQAEHIAERLSTDVCLPAIGQGAVGIECLSERQEIIDLLKPLGDLKTTLAVQAERALNLQLGGNCQSPIAGFAQWTAATTLSLTGLVASHDGQRRLLSHKELVLEPDQMPPHDHQPAHAIAQLGQDVAEDLLSQGAQSLLDAANAL